ncbi:MAG: hypothetical protein K2X81_07770, partial [Candidatus Obscuribacterales bacterium]|nr:hypothetical protein [Candidatus Obscuribacterales bacterium]
MIAKMSADEESIENLQKRKKNLEYTAMMMAVEGLVIPDDLAANLQDATAELEKRGGAAPIKRWTAWLGHTIEGFTLQQQLSTGTYSNVFKGVNEKTNETAAFKIAKTDIAIAAEPNNYFCKQAIAFNNEMVHHLLASPNMVLEEESNRLQNDKSGNFVKVLSSGVIDKCFYYRMPLLEGQSLKELMELTDMPFIQIALDVFTKLCDLVDKMSEQGSYHGNLQPDSIFFTKTDLVLLSPGSFAVIDQRAPSTPFLLSTPAYYPFYEANDRFALGCTFWEVICKRHPLDSRDADERSFLFTDELKQMLEYRKSLNHDPLRTEEHTTEHQSPLRYTASRKPSSAT